MMFREFYIQSGFENALTRLICMSNSMAYFTRIAVHRNGIHVYIYLMNRVTLNLLDFLFPPFPDLYM